MVVPLLGKPTTKTGVGNFNDDVADNFDVASVVGGVVVVVASIVVVASVADDEDEVLSTDVSAVSTAIAFNTDACSGPKSMSDAATTKSSVMTRQITLCPFIVCSEW